MPNDPEDGNEPSHLLGEEPCARCGTTPTTPSHIDPSTGFIEFDYYLCALCAITEVRSRPLTGLLTAQGLTGLPDPEGLPSIMQITNLDQPSDTEISDGSG